MTAAALTLAHWLRLLWNISPPLRLDSDAPFISDGAIHLPACSPWQAYRAAAAHAAAHRIYSPTRFEATGMVPIARSLLALLEDARVEALAMRELPGLARLWRPLHTATAADGNGFEPLMARLARALADPTYADPNPWVQKGRRLFYLDDKLGLLALRTPAELRGAALLLGHDIGQLRLPFNAKGYRPQPAYRDDHRWMWAADQLAAVQPPPPAPGDTGPPQNPDDPMPAPESTLSRQPEWDHRIHRLRPDWCGVTEQRLPAPLAVNSSAQPPAYLPAHAPAQTWAQAQALSRQLLAPLRTLTRSSTPRGRCHHGEMFELDALVNWCSARRNHLPADGRVYRGPKRQATRGTVWLLIDQSASTAAPLGVTGHSVLQAAAAMAAALALGLQSLGLRCAVSAFSSNGRHAVALNTLKRPDEPVDDRLGPRLAALRSGGSTRLGAALRHVTAGLTAASAGARWVWLLSDGQPHDIDVHDPRYLVADARHAVNTAALRAVRMRCLTLGSTADPDARRIFGPGGSHNAARMTDLPRALQRLMP